VIALIIVGVILLIVVLAGLIRLSVTVSIGEKVTLKVYFGPLSLLPRIKKKQKSAEKAAPTTPTESKKRKNKKQIPKPTTEEIIDLLRAALPALNAALKKTCRHLRIEPFELCIIIGGSDPADVASLYGYANAVLWTFMPQIEDTFFIPSPAIHLGMDYDATKSTVSGTIGVSARVFEIFAIALTLARPLLKWYRCFKRAHREKIATDQTTALKNSEKLTA